MTLIPLTDLPKTPERLQVAEEHAEAVLRTFDVNEASCFADDRDHLLASLESGFSDLSRFNEITSQAMLYALKRSRHSRRTSGSTWDDEEHESQSPDPRRCSCGEIRESVNMAMPMGVLAKGVNARVSESRAVDVVSCS